MGCHQGGEGAYKEKSFEGNVEHTRKLGKEASCGGKKEGRHEGNGALQNR
jgi:hypothetical protein